MNNMSSIQYMVLNKNILHLLRQTVQLFWNTWVILSDAVSSHIIRHQMVGWYVNWKGFGSVHRISGVIYQIFFERLTKITKNELKQNIPNPAQVSELSTPWMQS
jgi:hypothetical protein